ncbi:MAG: hypothetical protein MHPSP_004564, partial [Paramarteilia canceri]
GIIMKDVFLCHVTEDKNSIVIPLYEKLESSNIKCWLDEAEIKWGDSIINKVNEGLKNSRYLVVIISKNFTEKNWVYKELNSILNIEASTGDVKVLPILCGTKEEQEEIIGDLPIMNDKSYLVWDGNPQEVVDAFYNREKEGDNIDGKEKNKKKPSLFIQYGAIGGLLGLIADMFIFYNDENSIYSLIGMGLTMIYGYIVGLIYDTSIPKIMPLIYWKSSQSKEFYHSFVTLLPNIIALPFMGAVLGDYLYETYIATIIGLLVGFGFGFLIKFKLSSVASAIIWTVFGMFTALEYGDGAYETFERFSTYGALGAILGLLLSLFVGILIGAVRGLLGSKASASEEVSDDEL